MQRDLNKDNDVTNNEIIGLYKLIRENETIQNILRYDSPYVNFYMIMHQILEDEERLMKVLKNEVVYPAVLEYHPSLKCQLNCEFCYNQGSEYKELLGRKKN